MMPVCYIALGSNLNNPQQQLNAAKTAIDKISKTKVMMCSSIYQSQAMILDDEPQGDYLNAVIQIHTDLAADVLLDELQSIENQQGRVREKRWGERTIDLDIVLFGDQKINTERLSVPHCEMKNRKFVLYPLHQISPELKFPDNMILKDLLSTVSDQSLHKLGEFDE